MNVAYPVRFKSKNWLGLQLVNKSFSSFYSCLPRYDVQQSSKLASHTANNRCKSTNERKADNHGHRTLHIYMVLKHGAEFYYRPSLPVYQIAGGAIYSFVNSTAISLQDTKTHGCLTTTGNSININIHWCRGQLKKKTRYTKHKPLSTYR